MKISKRTMEILKNFSTINGSMMFRAGDQFGTVNPSATIMAFAKVEEQFPLDFGIYELGKFLSCISLLEDPDFVFEEDFAVMTSGSHGIRYYYADERQLQSCIPTDDERQTFEDILDEDSCTVVLPWDDYAKVMKGASIMDRQEVCFEITDGEVFFKAIDFEDPDSNAVSVTLGTTDIPDSKYVLSKDTMRLISGDYEVQLSEEVARFTTDNGNIVYYMGLEYED